MLPEGKGELGPASNVYAMLYWEDLPFQYREGGREEGGRRKMWEWNKRREWKGNCG